MEIAESPYGSDNVGLVCGYLFKATEPGHAVASGTAASALAQWSGGSGEFLWLHFALTHVASEQWLRRHLDIPEDFYELMKATRSSTRIEVADGALLGVINDVAFFSTEASSAVATMTLYVTDRVMVSARTTQLRSVDRLRSAVKRGALPLTIVPGMFGMNVAGIPFSQHASGFWVIVLSITGAVTAAGALAWSRYRGRLF